MAEYYTLDTAIESMKVHAYDAQDQLKDAQLRKKYYEGYYNGIKIGLTMLEDIKRGLEDEHNNEETKRTETV